MPGQVFHLGLIVKNHYFSKNSVHIKICLPQLLHSQAMPLSIHALPTGPQIHCQSPLAFYAIFVCDHLLLLDVQLLIANQIKWINGFIGRKDSHQIKWKQAFCVQLVQWLMHLQTDNLDTRLSRRKLRSTLLILFSVNIVAILSAYKFINS